MKEIINTLLDEYLAPIMVFIIMAGIIAGLVANLNKIRNADKDIKNEGLMGMIYVAGGTIIVAFLFGALFKVVISSTGGWSI
ncbi:MAG: hypothetical protein HRT66_04680 [Flavobacteriaceae bacterium]|nr:hypothetical protein [Flavobacteriaceae bacterium]